MPAKAAIQATGPQRCSRGHFEFGRAHIRSDQTQDVMAGLVPAIHVEPSDAAGRRERHRLATCRSQVAFPTWMAGTRLHKAGHDNLYFPSSDVCIPQRDSGMTMKRSTI
jgi:hypothetical protein